MSIINEREGGAKPFERLIGYQSTPKSNVEAPGDSPAHPPAGGSPCYIVQHPAHSTVPALLFTKFLLPSDKSSLSTQIGTRSAPSSTHPPLQVPKNNIPFALDGDSLLLYSEKHEVPYCQ